MSSAIVRLDVECEGGEIKTHGLVVPAVLRTWQKGHGYVPVQTERTIWLSAPVAVPCTFAGEAEVALTGGGQGRWTCPWCEHEHDLEVDDA